MWFVIGLTVWFVIFALLGGTIDIGTILLMPVGILTIILPALGLSYGGHNRGSLKLQRGRAELSNQAGAKHIHSRNFRVAPALTMMHLRDKDWYLQRAAHCSRYASKAADPLEKSGWKSLQAHYVKLARSAKRKPTAYEARPPSRAEEYRPHR